MRTDILFVSRGGVLNFRNNTSKTTMVHFAAVARYKICVDAFDSGRRRYNIITVVGQTIIKGNGRGVNCPLIEFVVPYLTTGQSIFSPLESSTAIVLSRKLRIRLHHSYRSLCVFLFSNRNHNELHRQCNPRRIHES